MSWLTFFKKKPMKPISQTKSNLEACQWMNVIINKVMRELLFKNSEQIKQMIMDKLNNQIKLPDELVWIMFSFC